MKAKMKKLTSIKTVVTLVLMIVPALALAAAREPVYVQGDTILTGPTTGEGTATLSIRGEEVTASVQITVKQLYFSEEGVLHVNEVEHVFTLLDEEGKKTGNSFSTPGREVGDPTDEFMLFTLNGYMKIINGTGTYEGASGEMSVHGQIHLVEGWASYESHGAISR